MLNSSWDGHFKYRSEVMNCSFKETVGESSSDPPIIKGQATFF